MSQSQNQASAWDKLNARIESCRKCERLVEYCRRVAREKRAAYREWNYWGGPVGNFGCSDARLLVVGLAPAAHGANRTGRMFTGDSAGEWLYRALYKAGFASQPHSSSRDDGLELLDCAITGALHCAPPDNMPNRGERERCRLWLEETIDLLPVKVLVALGGLAWQEIVQQIRRHDWYAGPKPKFGHGAKVALAGGRWLVGSFHPSRQNTNTRRLTEPMFDEIFAAARSLLAHGRNGDRAAPPGRSRAAHRHDAGCRDAEADVLCSR
jgi:uracil-DNA glycosylase family 4